MTALQRGNTRILIVEDDLELASLIQEYLTGKQFDVTIEHNGGLAVARILNEQPELVILDLMLPGKDGISICREVRVDYRGPILMLTASNDSVDQILGLEIGADDFVQKPVEPRLLLARIHALLRRSLGCVPAGMAQLQSVSAERLLFGDLSLNLSAREVNLQGQRLDFSAPEYDMLAYLAKHAGSIISRDQLFQQLRNIEYDGQNRFVDITMSHIRRKLGDGANRYLKTVRGKGYLFAVSA